MTVDVIDFDAIGDIGLKGIRRAAVFMGLGLNAACDPNFKNYQLSKIQNVDTNININFIPSNVSDRTLAHFKDNFATWIIANGLREVVENFAVFLDAIFRVCQMIAVRKQNFEPSVAEKLDNEFRYSGLARKLASLADRFNVAVRYPHYIISINQARNCLTHRLGRVGTEDCNGGQALEVKWLGMNIEVEFESGKVVPLNDIRGVVLPEPGTVRLRFVERQKVVPLGSVLKFEMYDLAEICNFMLDSIRQINGSAVDFARDAGVEIQEKMKEVAEISS